MLSRVTRRKYIVSKRNKKSYLQFATSHLEDTGTKLVEAGSLTNKTKTKA